MYKVLHIWWLCQTEKRSFKKNKYLLSTNLASFTKPQWSNLSLKEEWGRAQVTELDALTGPNIPEVLSIFNSHQTVSLKITNLKTVCLLWKNKIRCRKVQSLLLRERFWCHFFVIKYNSLESPQKQRFFFKKIFCEGEPYFI